jgi:hypothetical protein
MKISPQAVLFTHTFVQSDHMEEVQVSRNHQNVLTVLQETIVRRKVLSLLQVCVMQVIFVLEDQRLPDHMETELMEMVMLMAHLNMTQMVFGPQQIVEVSALPEDIVKLVPKTNYLAKEDTTTQKLEQKLCMNAKNATLVTIVLEKLKLP